MAEPGGVSVSTDGIYIRRLERSWSVMRFFEDGIVVVATATNVGRRTADVAGATRAIAEWLVRGAAGMPEAAFEIDGEKISFTAADRHLEGTLREGGHTMNLRWEGKRRWTGQRTREEGSWLFSPLVEVQVRPAPPREEPAARPRPDEAKASCAAGRSLEAEGRPLEAEAAFGRADELGSPEAALHLGLLLEGRGMLAPAIAAYARADERGSALGAYQHGMSLATDRSRKHDCIRALVRAESRGYAKATDALDRMVTPLPGEHRLSLEGRRAALRRL